MFEEVLNKLNAFIADVEAVKRQLADKDEEIAQLKQQASLKVLLLLFFFYFLNSF